MSESADSKIQTITKFAVKSRFVILSIQVIANLLVPDHDAHVFNPPANPRNPSSKLNEIINVLLGGFKRWDGVYFQHVAEYGYTYENTLAFFPLFPMVTRFFANILFYPLQHFVSYSTNLLLCAFLLNNYLFVKTVQILYQLGLKVLNEESLAFKAALLFCFNPASIFMSAPYSETIYCFLLLHSLYCLQENSEILSSALIGICSLSRSNGLIVFGFVIHSLLRKYMTEIYYTRQTKFKTAGDQNCKYFVLTFTFFVKLFVCGIFTILPVLIYQYICYTIFCDPESSITNIPDHIIQYGLQMKYHLVGDKPSPWCYNLIPLSYSYVQKKYWEVGFLAYYEFKQIPNFMLAAPIIVLGMSCCVAYIKLNANTCLTLGLVNQSNTIQKKYDKVKVECGFTNQKLLVYCGHLLFLLVFGVFFMHIQVLTRFLCSSCPILFWFAAYLATDKIQQQKFNGRNTNSKNILVEQFHSWSTQHIYFKLISIYFLSYFVLGTIAFSNFLPFT